MALQQFSVTVTQMHATSLTIAEHVAFTTVLLVHPFSVSIKLETVFPHVHEVVLIDVALVVIGAYAGAGRDAAIDEDGADGDASLTEKAVVAHIQFEFAYKTFASVCRADTSFATSLSDKL